MKVSIITPAYNAEKYIKRCLDHSLGQSYANIEVILVDDGSTDKTVSIAKQYAERDTRLKVMQQNHAGPNLARKKALDIATGDYVLFVDVDDYLVKNAVAILVDKIKHSDADSIRFNAKYYRDNKIVFPILEPNEKGRVIKHDEIISILLTTYSLNSLCTQAYKTELIRNINAFNSSIVFGEDFLVNLEVHNKTKEMLLIPDVLYCYCDNPTSTTHNQDKTQFLKNLSDRVLVSKEAITYTAKHVKNDSLKNKINYTQLLSIKDTIQNLAKISNYDKDTFLTDIKKALPANSFTEVNADDLAKYIQSLPLVRKFKNRRLVEALLHSDYETIWKYLKTIKIYKTVHIWGGKK